MLISIVYDSGYGHTAKQAQAMAEGARKATYSGSVSFRFKRFMEDSTKPAWLPQKWRNKIAAGFTNSGAQHGDKLNSLISVALFAAHSGKEKA